MTREAGLIRLPSRGALAAIILGLGAALVRLGALDHLALNGREAAAALHAALGTPNASPFFAALAGGSGEAAYEGLTALLFFWFGPSDAMARLVPALAGLALALWPLALHRKLGWPRALVLAALLSFSPHMVAVARTAGAFALALLGAALVGGAWVDEQGLGRARGPLLAIGLGMLLAGGPAAFHGLLSLALAGLACWALSKAWRMPALEAQWARPFGRWWWAGALTLFLLSTGLGLEISRLSAFTVGLERWMAGWAQGGGVPAWVLLVNLLTFDGLALVFGTAAAVGALRQRDRVASFAALWGLAALALILIYPARHPLDMAWVVLPFSFLAAHGIVRWIESEHDRHSLGWQVSLVGAILVIVVFVYLQLARAGQPPEVSGLVRTALPISAFALVAAALMLFGLGWSWHGARDVLVVAAGLVLVLASVSGLGRSQFAAQAREGPGLLRPQAATPSLPLLVQTAARVSLAQVGTAHGLELYFAHQPPPELAWALRDWKPWQGSFAERGTSAPLILARAGLETVPFSERYLGQSFAIRARWQPAEGEMRYLDAWLEGKLPATYDQWVLLVREDDLMRRGIPGDEGP